VPLRKITEDDEDDLVTWRNANAEFFPPGPKLTRKSHYRWYLAYLDCPWDHMYMVMEGRVPVGTVAIDIRSKMIGRVLRGRPEGKGAMSRALRELMSLYGEGAYTLQVLDGNTRAVEFYERLGFREFGRQRKRNPDITLISMRYERNY
jgi:RimJ/RimL family protein N-acetyltransferase